jgi:hypothetical protein
MNQESHQPNPLLEHPKTTQYVNRISGGEDAGMVLEGLPESMQAAVRERLGLNNPEASEAVVEKHPSNMDEEELQSFINETIPFQYRGLPAEALESVWAVDNVPYYLDDPNGERRQVEIQKRALALTALETFLPEARKCTIHKRLAEVGRKAKIADVRQELLEEPAPEVVSDNLDRVTTSSELDELSTHRFESAEKGVSVLHTNKEHGQDAFAVDLEKGVACVSDGASSYGKSGPISAEFSRSLVTDAASGKPFAEIFSENNMRSIADRVRTGSAFKNFNTDENPYAKGENREAGLATVLLTRANKESKTIEWASVGDSPLMVLDRNPDGSYSFEIVNDDVDGMKFTDKNFTDEKMAEGLGNPETHLVGIGRDGNPRLNDLKHIRQGSIEYKQGRVVVMASDFLTKMMALSPQMIDARIALARQNGKESLAKSLEDIQANTASANNPLAQKRFNPSLLFDGSLTEEELKRAVEGWKDIRANNQGIDDMTAICIKMDKMFAQVKVEKDHTTTGGNELAFAA